VLACLRAMGMGIDDMRTYQANRVRSLEREAGLRTAVRRGGADDAGGSRWLIRASGVPWD
jgi:hypothetical protein